LNIFASFIFIFRISRCPFPYLWHSFFNDVKIFITSFYVWISRLNVLFIMMFITLYGTAVEHRSLLNRSGICDGIICCNIFLFIKPFWV